jgi:hypothetical protein
MAIDTSTLLQVDATAIVGIFIFLTIQSFSYNTSEYQQTRTRLFLTSFLVVPFAISALAILVEDNWNIEKEINECVNIPKVAAIGYII